jgi:hypothetical protein
MFLTNCGCMLASQDLVAAVEIVVHAVDTSNTVTICLYIPSNPYLQPFDV